MTAVAAAVLTLAVAPATPVGAAGFDEPASPDTSQQFTPPPDPGNPQRQDTPNDPDYDQSEPDAGGPGNLFDERYDLFGFPSALTPTATYNDPADQKRFLKRQVSGFNAAGAWKATRGDPEIGVAVLDTGINWNACGLRDKVDLNEGELAGDQRPQKVDGSYGTPAPGNLDGRDLNGNGAFDVDDYADDRRVKAQFTSCDGKITAKDLIDTFDDETDADGNGYVDDIAGWDHFDDDNDPTDASSYFAAENHGTGRANEAVEKGNDGAGSIGVCPRCQFVPFRVWDTFVADANNFGMAVMYAADNDIEVIVGADGALYHSAFMEAASKYAYQKGVVQVYSGNDLNTGNHNYPANYNHTMLIQGVATDVQGLGTNPQDAQKVLKGLCDAQPLICLGSSALPTTYFRGANTTQFGGHSSVSMEGPTGSANTGKAGGALALVLSAAKVQKLDLSPDEARSIVEQTAEDITQPNTGTIGVPDPAQPGWDEHFGYGRVDLGAAVAIAKNGKPPPEASIVSPDWYAPLTGAKARLTGRLRARHANEETFGYTVEWGPGLAPAESEWRTIKTQTNVTGTATDLGELDLNQIRATLAARTPPPDLAGPTFSPTSRNPFKDQFTVRVTVTGDGIPTKGVDRKVLTALPDGQKLRPGFPKRLGTGGEAPLRYADLNGDNVQELILPLEDGTIHAYRPDGSELPGWPVKTRTHYSATEHAGAGGFKAGIHQPREPLRGPTIADLDDDGSPEVITAAGLRIYVFGANGRLRDGFPVRSDPANCDPADQRKENDAGGAWHRKCGFLATPAVGRIEGKDKPLNIVAPSLDGHLYVLRENGTNVPNFPKELVDPAKPANEKRFAESINQPAIGDIGGGPGGAPDGRDDIVVPTNEAYGGPSNGGDVSFAGVLGNAAGQENRVYAVNGATGGFLPGWPIGIAGIIQNVLPLIGPGHDPAIAKIGGEPRVIASATSGSLGTYGPDGKLRNTMQQGAGLNLFEAAAVGRLVAPTGDPNIVKYQVDVGQAANLLLVGQNVKYSHRIGAWESNTGATMPGYPTITDDYQFLSSSTIAKVTAAGPTQQVIAGTGLGLLHAYDGATAQDVPGFPKVTGGWMFAPAAVSDDGRIAGITREGFLFEWSHAAAAECQSEWPSFRHDPQGSGNYDRDGTAPGALEDFTLTRLGGNRYRVAFTSTGDDAGCGKPAKYVAELGGRKVDLKLTGPVAGGERYAREITVPAGTPATATLSVRAYDEAGNGGFPARMRLNQARPLGAGTPRGPGTSACIDSAAPSARIDRRSRLRRTRVNVFGGARDTGCASDGRVARVQVAIARRAKGRCRFLKRNRKFSARKRCGKPHYIDARRGYSSRLRASRYRLKRGGLKLRRGRYVVTVRARDGRGNIGAKRVRRLRVR